MSDSRHKKIENGLPKLYPTWVRFYDAIIKNGGEKHVYIDTGNGRIISMQKVKDEVIKEILEFRFERNEGLSLVDRLYAETGMISDPTIREKVNKLKNLVDITSY